jgi:hypothetical protein
MYISLLLFVSSDNWIWELQEDYPVKPVAELVRRWTPPNQPVYTSFPRFRPSLDFYSHRQVIPAGRDELLRRLKTDHAPYFLVPDRDLVLFKGLPIQSKAKIIQGWSILTRAAQAPTKPDQRPKPGIPDRLI